MVDSEVAGINTHDESESLEDLTIYEVVTDYQGAPPISTTNYPHIFLQLLDGQIINVENGEIIISLSQFVATDESAEPLVSDTTSIFSSQTSPRLLYIDSEYMTSTQEGYDQQEASFNESIVSPPTGPLNRRERRLQGGSRCIQAAPFQLIFKSISFF